MTNLQAQVVNRLPAELGQLGRDGQQRVVGRLLGQIVQFRAGDRVLPCAAAQLGPRDAQQHLVQPADRKLAAPAGPAEGGEPLRCLLVQPVHVGSRISTSRDGPARGQSADTSAGSTSFILRGDGQPPGLRPG